MSCAYKLQVTGQQLQLLKIQTSAAITRMELSHVEQWSGIQSLPCMKLTSTVMIMVQLFQIQTFCFNNLVEIVLLGVNRGLWT